MFLGQGWSKPAKGTEEETKMAGMAKVATRSVREVMDIRGAADYLGISPDTLYKYASEGLIPAFKLGNRWRFKRSLMENWMEQQSGVAADRPVLSRARPRQKKPVARAR